MSLMGLVLFLIVVGIALWMFPLEATIKNIVIGLVVIVSAIWLFAAMGWVNTPVAFR